MTGFIAGKSAEDMSSMRQSNIILNALKQLDQMFGEGLLLLGMLCKEQDSSINCSIIGCVRLLRTLSPLHASFNAACEYSCEQKSS